VLGFPFQEREISHSSGACARRPSATRRLTASPVVTYRESNKVRHVRFGPAAVTHFDFVLAFVVWLERRKQNRWTLLRNQTQSRKNGPICQGLCYSTQKWPVSCSAHRSEASASTVHCRVPSARRRRPYMLPTAAAGRTASVVVTAPVGEARSCSVTTTDGTAASPLF
jgi:hypothetical protein